MKKIRGTLIVYGKGQQTAHRKTKLRGVITHKRVPRDTFSKERYNGVVSSHDGLETAATLRPVSPLTYKQIPNT